MCTICHEDAHDNPVSIDLVKASEEARAAEHGDGNPDCLRVIHNQDGSQFIGCMDCGDHHISEDHVCYTS